MKADRGSSFERLRGNLGEVWRRLRRVAAILWQSAPRLALVTPLLVMIEVAAAIALLFLTKSLIDMLAADAAAQAQVPAAVTLIVLVGICGALFLTARSLAAFAREAQGLAVAERIDFMIHTQAIEVDYGFYESPRYHDTLMRARQAGKQRPAQVVNNLVLLTKNGVLAVAGLIVIAMLSGVLLLIVLVFVALALAVRLHHTGALYRWRVRRTQLERRAAYLDWLLTSDHHAKELRTNGLGERFRGEHRDLRSTVRREQLDLTWRRTRLELAVGVVATLAFAGCLLTLILRIGAGEGSLGDLVLYVFLFQRAQNLGQEVVQQLSRLYEDHLYLGHLFAFLDMPRASTSASVRGPAQASSGSTPSGPAMNEGRGFAFEDVSFRYPGTRSEVLSGVSLRIEPGRFIALVGANGSGKTSLVKLLCRLYEPTRGRITYDGLDVRCIPLGDYRRLVSLIFQDYARYAASLGDNIAFGDPSMASDPERIEAVGRLAGVDEFAARLAKGYASPLTRLFDDGVELSVGQWQKVALARAFYRRSELIVMDEPTSALDPTAEAELFDTFHASLGARSALVVSHRLSTVRQADTIYVLDRGALVEHGAHHELIASPNVYARMFALQGRHFAPH